MSIKRGQTNFLRLVIFAWGLGVLALCVFALPSIYKGGSAEYPAASQALLLIMLGLYATAIPFFIGLWQALKLLSHIDRGEAFSGQPVRVLRNIKYCAGVIAVLYVCGVPLLLPIAQADDAPGLMVMGVVIACLPITVAVFASVLEKLFRQAAEMK